ncbi:MAG: hypothetical protein OXI96_09175 [Acidimicrobiaceae bacterium]|nr:hypothetical protein [Acidimicrobiaceae bacterium]
MKRHRDINATQKTAWSMLHRIRKAHDNNNPSISGVIEVDETYIG